MGQTLFSLLQDTNTKSLIQLHKENDYYTFNRKHFVFKSQIVSFQDWESLLSLIINNLSVKNNIIFTPTLHALFISKPKGPIFFVSHDCRVGLPRTEGMVLAALLSTNKNDVQHGARQHISQG